MLSGKEIFPVIEGGKGISVSNGVSAGHFAANNAVGTFSGVNAQVIDENGEYAWVRIADVSASNHYLNKIFTLTKWVHISY